MISCTLIFDLAFDTYVIKIKIKNICLNFKWFKCIFGIWQRDFKNKTLYFTALEIVWWFYVAFRSKSSEYSARFWVKPKVAKIYMHVKGFKRKQMNKDLFSFEPFDVQINFSYFRFDLKRRWMLFLSLLQMPFHSHHIV